MTVTRTGPNFATIAANLAALDNMEARTGWFETARYNDKKATPVAYIATIQEFGYPPHNIPPRPFMRPAVVKHGKEWLDLLAQGAASILQGHTTPEAVLEIVALRAAADVAEEINKVTSPRLSPVTLMHRRQRGNQSEKPLIDTGQMIASVTGVVTRAGSSS